MDKEQVYKELERMHILKEKCTTVWQLELVYHRIDELHKLLDSECEWIL